MPVIIPKIWQTASSHTIADMLQTSVLAPHLAPRMTSGERYWRVWISFVKWCPTQQAFPRSAILTDIVSIALARSSWLVSFGEADLFREIPDIVWERFSLDILSAWVDCTGERVYTYAVFSWCFWSSSVLLEGAGSARPSISRMDLGGVVEAIAPLITTPVLGVAET